MDELPIGLARLDDTSGELGAARDARGRLLGRHRPRRRPRPMPRPGPMDDPPAVA